jgi:hypothetical protein
MTAITTPRFKESTDSLLRFSMRADAICSGVMGIVGIPLAGWLAKTSGTSIAFEYTVSALFIVFGATVFWLAAQPSVRRSGLILAIGNFVYTVASVIFVFTDVFPLTTTGVVLTLAVGVYTLIMAELQYQGWRRAKA